MLDKIKLVEYMEKNKVSSFVLGGSIFYLAVLLDPGAWTGG
jgi:hypothetical protein